MKLYKTVIFPGILFLLSGISFGQSVDDIIAKHIKAHGGEKSWNEVSSVELTGRYTSFSEEHDFYAIKTKKGKYYSDLNIGQHKVKEAFNGKEGWTVDPWHDFTFPRKLNKAEQNVFFQKADLFTPFFHYKEKGYKVDYIGEKTIEGRETFALKLTRTNEEEETWYLDKKTYLEFKCESMWIDFAVGLPCETYFDDFRKVDGKLIPFYTERMFGQRNHILELSEVKFDVKLDEALLKMPRSEEMKSLEFLEGKWNVSIERMGRRGTMQKVDETVSKCKFKAVNLLQMKFSFDDYYVHDMILYFSYHKDIKKYVVTVFNEFSSAVNVYEGEMADGVFTVDNSNSTKAELDNTISQFSIYDIKENAFIIELKRSTDKGETWSPNYKFTFSK